MYWTALYYYSTDLHCSDCILTTTELRQLRKAQVTTARNVPGKRVFVDISRIQMFPTCRHVTFSTSHLCYWTQQSVLARVWRELHCSALHCTVVLFYIALHYTALHCTAMHCTVGLFYSALHCIVVLFYTTLVYCSTLHCFGPVWRVRSLCVSGAIIM